MSPAELAERLGTRFADVVESRGEVTVIARARRSCSTRSAWLREEPELEMSFLVDRHRTDWPGQDPRYWLAYDLLSPARGQRVRVKVGLPADDPHVPSVTGLFPTANWHEREIFDFFGIVFDGHPDLSRILLPDDWEGYPLRKTEALGGVNTAFHGAFIPTGGRATRRRRDGGRHDATRRAPPGDDDHQHGSAAPVDARRAAPGPRARRRVRRLLHVRSSATCTPGIEKNTEYRTWQQGATFVTRADYLAPFFNELGYCLAVERLLGIEAPPRAQTIRVLFRELNRITSHLVWLATTGLELGAVSIMLYGFREREQDPRHLRDGDRPSDEPRVHPHRRRRSWISPRAAPRRSASSSSVLPGRTRRGPQDPADDNPIWIERNRGVGVLTAEEALRLGVTGPMLRACGVAMDVRKDFPYSGYETYDFDVPTQTEGDCYARYQVRMDEMLESLKIVTQCLERLERRPATSWSRTPACAGRRSSRWGRTGSATRPTTCATSWRSRWRRSSTTSRW